MARKKITTIQPMREAFDGDRSKKALWPPKGKTTSEREQ